MVTLTENATHLRCVLMQTISKRIPMYRQRSKVLLVNNEFVLDNSTCIFTEELADGPATENLSLESNESMISSGISETASSPSSSSCTKRARTDCTPELKNKRAFLFNKLVQLMPPSMVQPERNLSDFVVM